MDGRLIPINGLIALLRGDGGWPNTLGEMGFERHQLELPVSTPLGSFQADAVIFRCSPDAIVLVECKGGGNIEPDQAAKYVSADAEWLRRSGAIPPPLRGVKAPAVEALFVGREEYRERLERGLQEINVSAPLLTVGPRRIHLSGASGSAYLDDFLKDHDQGLPPARIPVDHQSNDEELLEFLLPEIVAAQARREDIIAVESICERILPEWPILALPARGEFARRIAKLAKGLQSNEMKGQIRYEALKEPHSRGRLRILRSPAARDPRGRTGSFQAQQSKAESVLDRKAGKRPPGQTSLLDEMAEEGGLADD